MFRIWGKIWKDSRLIKDMVVTEDDPGLRRTAKVFRSVTQLCNAFDLPEPIWLDQNIKEFRSRSKTRFSSDSFIEAVDFDYLEIQVIEE